MLKTALRWFALPLLFMFGLPLLLAGITHWRLARIPASSILHVQLDGSVPEAPPPPLSLLWSKKGDLSLRGLTATMRRAAHDDAIVGMVLDVRNPQIGLAQLHELRDAVAAFRASGKWNLAFIETAGEFDSGDIAYALATSAQQVMLVPTGEVSLTGLRSEVPFVRDTLERLHISPYTEQRYEFKNYVNTFTERSFTPQHREALKAVVDDLQNSLLGHLVASRGIDMTTARRWVEASPYGAEEALQAHLVDRLGYWDEVEAEAAKVAGRAQPWVSAGRYSTALANRGGGSGPSIALITAAGDIQRGERGTSPWETSGAIGSETFAEAFRRAREDKVAGVLFRISSPGGSYLASDIIRREVQLTRQSGIPVVVSMGDVAASGGYFVAIEADHVVAEASTITGSIGVLAASFPLRQPLQHFFGVNFDTYAALPHPGVLSWLDAPNAADRERFGAAIDRIYHDFVAKVAVGRKQPYDAIHQLAKGRIWSGRQALEHGLVDALGGYEVALAYLRQRLQLPTDAPVQLVSYPSVDGTLAILRQVLGAQLHGSVSTPPLPQAVERLWRSLQAPTSAASLRLPEHGLPLP